MLRFVVFISLFLLLQIQNVYSDSHTFSNSCDLMNNREVLGVLLFKEGESGLSDDSKIKIDNLIPLIKKYNPDSKIIRIEGFASTSGNENMNVRLSMSRAKSVIDYIIENHNLGFEIYLSGFGSKDSPMIQNDQRCSAEIVLYDNMWKEFELKTDMSR